jgi:hypothetical protein
MTVAFVRKAQALPGKEFEAVMCAKKIAELSAKIIGTAVTTWWPPKLDQRAASS